MTISKTLSSVLCVMVIFAVGTIIIVPFFLTKSKQILTDGDVEIEAENVLIYVTERSIIIRRNCCCKAKELARLTNLSDMRTSRIIQLMGTDNTVLAQWELPLLPKDTQVVRLPNKENGLLRIRKNNP